MTERERIAAVDVQEMTTADEVLAATRPFPEVVHPSMMPEYVTRTLVVMPVDRVSWSAVLTGLFVTLATFTLLSVLGLAAGLATVGPATTSGTLGIGVGAWSAISALLALVIGGWAAARTAAVPGRANGALNGAMVWMVILPLALVLLGTGIVTLEAVAGDLVAAGAQVATPLIGQVAPGNTSAITNSSLAAWGTLIALLLGLVAATFGGLLGARSVMDLATTGAVPLEHTTLH